MHCTALRIRLAGFDGIRSVDPANSKLVRNHAWYGSEPTESKLGHSRARQRDAELASNTMFVAAAIRQQPAVSYEESKSQAGVQGEVGFTARHV